MTVYNLIDLLCDATTVEIFSLDKCETVYNGYSDEIPDEIGEAEIASIDLVFSEIKHLTINID